MGVPCRWLVTIIPTAQGLANHPTWKTIPGPIAVYDKDDLDRRVALIRAAMAAGDIAAFAVKPVK